MTDEFTPQQRQALIERFASMPYGGIVSHAKGTKLDTFDDLLAGLDRFANTLRRVANESVTARRTLENQNNMLAGVGELILAATEAAQARRDGNK